MGVERDAGLHQGREHVERPVGEAGRVARRGKLARAGLGEEVEDLAVEHVDAAVGQVGQGLGRVRLLLEALDPAVLFGDDHTELGGLLDLLRGEGRDAVVRLVELLHRNEVDVGQGDAGDDQKRFVEEFTGRVHTAGRPQQILFEAVAEVDPEIGAVAEVALDRVGEPVEVGDDAGETLAAEQLDDVLHDRPVQDRHHRLGHRVCDRAQAGAKTCSQHHRLHQAVPNLRLKSCISSTGVGSIPRS